MQETILHTLKEHNDNISRERTGRRKTHILSKECWSSMVVDNTEKWLHFNFAMLLRYAQTRTYQESA